MAARKSTKSTPAPTTKSAVARPPSRKVRENAARRSVIATAQAMSTGGLSPGRSGNVSCRWEGGMLITPSGLPYDTLKLKDIVFVAENGRAPVKTPKPSSEWRFHLAVYSARSDCQAIVHAHSQNATVLACRHTPIPAFHYMVAIAGGRMIPCVPYAAFGTEELAAHVISGLVETDACLMANHGQIAIGTSLDNALELAHEIETLAAQYVQVLSLGKPKLLSDAQMDDVLERFKGYGQNA
ncbi:MAG: class II aldolase/adducin family protein [Pseudomonadota bacterium]